MQIIVDTNILIEHLKTNNHNALLFESPFDISYSIVTARELLCIDESGRLNNNIRKKVGTPIKLSGVNDEKLSMFLSIGTDKFGFEHFAFEKWMNERFPSSYYSFFRKEFALLRKFKCIKLNNEIIDTADNIVKSNPNAQKDYNDLLIASTGQFYNYPIVTKNDKDFTYLKPQGLQVIKPDQLYVDNPKVENPEIKAEKTLYKTEKERLLKDYRFSVWRNQGYHRR